MDNHKILMELEDIQYRYERLASLIGILQQFTAEVVEIAGAPSDSLTNALHEIRIGMDENNEKMRRLLFPKEEGGAA